MESYIDGSVMYDCMLQVLYMYGRISRKGYISGILYIFFFVNYYLLDIYLAMLLFVSP